ncbi:MAG: 30S ribosomal protein S20 [Puniceicoccaceae bacterium]
MANTKSSIKDIRKIARRTEHNRQVRSRLKTLTRKVRELSTSEDVTARREAAIQLISSLDKAAKTGIIHRNKADRYKAACAKYITTVA